MGKLCVKVSYVNKKKMYSVLFNFFGIEIRNRLEDDVRARTSRFSDMFWNKLLIRSQSRCRKGGNLLSDFISAWTLPQFYTGAKTRSKNFAINR